MENRIDINNWSFIYKENRSVVKDKTVFTTTDEARNSGLTIIPASVPGNFELDLVRAGLLADPYYGDNILLLQRLENLHLWYFTDFDYIYSEDDCELYLDFEGIDTAAEILLNGEKAYFADNMLIGHEFRAEQLRSGKNSLVVHIIPFAIYARKTKLPAMCNTMAYEGASPAMRKAASTFGWDIIPRTVSGGLWKPVYLVCKKRERIDELYFYTVGIDTENRRAAVNMYWSIVTDEDFIDDIRIVVDGVCGSDESSAFHAEMKPWHTVGTMHLNPENCRFWYPLNAECPDMYDISVKLTRAGATVDERKTRFGIRTCELRRTSTEGGSDSDFCFYINGKHVFVLGSNWVPLDAFHSRDIDRLPRAMELVRDIGCNMLRCWGGNVYENNEFYDYCDENGIMIWQDFGMGCAVYPQDKQMCDALSREAVSVIKRLRNHPSLVLWAGDNECDLAYSWNRVPRDPNRNKLTREILRDAVEAHDMMRPYLPSSPFVDEEAYKTGKPTTEDHLWGPRDYFKGDFYKTSVCHFASETGYHGCPARESLEKFIRPDQLWPIFNENGVPGDDWILHGTNPDADAGGNFGYRTSLMANQVRVLFGEYPDNLDDFVRMSQISQAEAVKFFIERFRTSKWRRTGILWWNILDGWPQISDAVTDYFYRRKLAYFYIKRSQQPVCLMFDEPENGSIALVAVNDTPSDVTVSYTVNVMPENKTVMSDSVTIPADGKVVAGTLAVTDGEKEFLLIRWNNDGISGSHHNGENHYVTDIRGINYRRYSEAQHACGFDEYNG